MTDHLTDREAFYFEAARASQSRAAELVEENGKLKLLLRDDSAAPLRARITELEAEVTRFSKIAERLPKLEAENLDLRRACERLERSLGALVAAREIWVTHAPIEAGDSKAAQCLTNCDRGETP